VFAEHAHVMPLPVGEDGVGVSLLDVTRLVDPESTASRFLTPRERGEYGRLRHPSRRREWLGARVCLKTTLLRRHCISDPTQCEIMKDDRGRPWLSFAPGLPAGVMYDCSLSHKGRFACAGASNNAETGIGVDIEQVSPRLLKLAGVIVRDRDALIHSHPPEERLALLWALKEACAKAMGGGIGVALGEILCEETAEGRHRIRTPDGDTFRARHFLHEGHVIVLCLGRRASALRDC
jgi:phosphopantetheinyl transferase